MACTFSTKTRRTEISWLTRLAPGRATSETRSRGAGDIASIVPSKSHAGCALSLTTAECRSDRPSESDYPVLGSHGVVRKQGDLDGDWDERSSKKARFSDSPVTVSSRHSRTRTSPPRVCTTKHEATRSLSDAALLIAPYLRGPMEITEMDIDGCTIVNNLELIPVNSTPDFIGLTNMHRKSEISRPLFIPPTAQWVASTMLRRNQPGRPPRPHSFSRNSSTSPHVSSPLHSVFTSSNEDQ